MNKYETIIGLEVHTQLKTKSKIFCACAVDPDSEANTNICPVCCGYPGTLPVFNKTALELAVRVCLALNCDINPRIYFERKNYFYPDLPKDYQISQYKKPLGENGYLELSSGKHVGIARVHLEEDAGKLLHKEDCSLVDFNRSGTPLLEIVSKPDIASPQEAFEYLTYLKLTLQYILASDCDMEKGLLRCDANISLRRKGEDRLGVKIELKNLNSFRGVRDGLAYEQVRQEKVLESGADLSQETRLWNAEAGKTQVMRLKEEAHDYRYFPEPDLPDFDVPPEMVDAQKAFVGEPPLSRRRRFIQDYGVGAREAGILISNLKLADLFEESCRFFDNPKKIAAWLIGPFAEQVKALPGGLHDVRISAKNFAKVVELFSVGRINNLAAKRVLSLSLVSDEDVERIIGREGLMQLSGEDELSGFIEEVIEGNLRAVEEYRRGKQQAIMFLVGQVMKRSRGKANPKLAREMLESRIAVNTDNK